MQPHEIRVRVAEGRRVERRERVVEADVEGARAARALGGVLAGDAEGDERLGGGLERLGGLAARKQPVSAVDMQPVPVTEASSS